MNLAKQHALILLLLIFIAIACNHKVSTKGNNQQNQTGAKQLMPDTSRLWHDLEIPPNDKSTGTIKPDKFRLLTLDFNGIKRMLLSAPKEKERQTKEGVVINIPMPEGNYHTFMVYETEVMAPELAAKFPDIKTYGGTGIADKTMSIRLDFNPGGFHAMVITLNGSINIDPYNRSEASTYICYYKQDFNPGPKQQLPVDSLK